MQTLWFQRGLLLIAGGAGFLIAGGYREMAVVRSPRHDVVLRLLQPRLTPQSGLEVDVEKSGMSSIGGKRLAGFAGTRGFPATAAGTRKMRASLRYILRVYMSSKSTSS